MKRVESIDILRGFALMCMVLVHFIIYFGNEAAVVTPKNWTVDEEKSNYPVRGLRWASVDGFHPSSRRSGSWS